MKAQEYLLGGSLTAAAKAGREDEPVIAALNNLRKKCISACSLTAVAKAGAENKLVIAAVNRCATQNQVQHRVFPQVVKRCATQNYAPARVIQQPEPMDARQFFLRWLKFNFVGGIGIGVQLTALAALRSLLDLNYLLATALAVEAAVIHNFLWHERFTWADRPAASPVQSLVRLATFNLSNGGVSIAGNLLLMRLLVGELHLNYVLANLVAIAACSLANFLLSDRLVFQREGRCP